MKSLHSFVHRLHNPDVGILVLRLALGAVFMYHGYDKLQNMEGVIGFFGTLGFGPELAYLVALAELLGGIAFVVGAFVRYAGIVLAVVAVVALLKVHLPNGFVVTGGGYEFILVLLAGCVALVCLGAGRYAIGKNL